MAHQFPTLQRLRQSLRTAGWCSKRWFSQNGVAMWQSSADGEYIWARLRCDLLNIDSAAACWATDGPQR